ncbi:hypothetical protein SLS62_002321 [Diatrype stigma]|uniref:ERCC4 domain-containing protein n=1 Tax=Diatrype stigma TaxID=117547 RepID=A0AAN9V0I4_9PEZI
MPVEVIDLLSSPSTGPSPPVLNDNSASSQRAATPPGKTAAGPSRALDYDLLDLTVESPEEPTTRHATTTTVTTTTTSKFAVVGTKRTSSGHGRQDNDFLFLSGDDSEGDSLFVTKKPRVSLSPPSKRDGDSSLRRTASEAVGTIDVTPLPSVGMKRWNSMADPIEHSSSPHNAPTASHRHRVDENVLDRSAHPTKQTKGKAVADTSRLLELSSDDDPFASSPKKGPSLKSPKAHQAVNHDPLEKSSTRSGELLTEQYATRSKPPNRSNFIDLSSDTFDGPPKNDKGKTVKKPVAWDPISSSMPEKSTYARPFSSSPPAPRPGDRDLIVVDDLDSGSDSDEMPDLADIDFSKRKPTQYSYSASPQSKSKSTSKSISKSKPPTSRSASATTSKPAKPTPEEKEAEKKKKAEEREAEKERKRVQKEQEKAQRALENVRKKALEEVNKVRTDKKISTPEMIVDLPSSLHPGLLVQIQTLLQDIDVQHETWHSSSRGGVDNVVKWRRKVSSRYNEDLGHWEPLEPMRIEKEKHVLVIVGAAEFVKLALGGGGAAEGQDLEAHVLKIKVQHPDATVIYLIEGLNNWMRKNRTVRNRQFQSAVRGGGGGDESAGAAPPSSSNRRRAEPQIYIDEDSVEDALLSLQVLHGALIHHTAAPCETAQWVSVFTQHISTIPYKRAREAATSGSANFCMDSGQVRTGDGPRDTYVRMLQEMVRVTPPIALGIAAEFGSVAELVRGLEARGPLALEACRKCANRDGAFADRAVGPAVSRRVYKVFTGRDPGSAEV